MGRVKFRRGKRYPSKHSCDKVVGATHDKGARLEQAPEDPHQTKQETQAPQPQRTLLESLSNPLSLAVVGAFLTLMTTVVTNYLAQKAIAESEQFRAELARASARQELQAELIKKFVEAPKTETVRENLRFLVKAGLLPDYADNIQAYLDADSQAAPQLGVITKGVVGSDERTPLVSLDLTRQADFRGVGLLRITLGPGAQTFCSGFLVATNVVLAGQCGTALSPDNPNAKNSIASFDLFSATASNGTRLDLDKSRIAMVKSGDWDVVLIGVKPSNTAEIYMPLSANTPLEGEIFQMAFYASDKKTFVYSADAGCRVVNVGDRELGHLCDTGAGAGGGPLVTTEGAVIGVHMGNAEGAKRAMRADIIRKDPAVIKVFGELPTS
jgi:V8-like Glu-specific endopeptidase